MAEYTYLRRLLESPEISKSTPDDYWGIIAPEDITLKFSNADGYFTDLIQVEELRNKMVRVRRWDPNESGSHKLILEVFGKVVSYSLSDVAEITISSAINDKLQKQYPSKIYEQKDWTESRPNIWNPEDDIGKPYPLIFGRADRVPLLYVHCDMTNNRYDYIVGVGPIKSVQAVYSNGLKVTATNYTVFDGTQATPYPGYAFIRFVSTVTQGGVTYTCKLRHTSSSTNQPGIGVRWATYWTVYGTGGNPWVTATKYMDGREQRDGNGSLYKFTADVYGLTLGGTDESRNFATVIQHFLSNSTWGMGEAVSLASFTQAAADLDAIGTYYCDGHVISQRSGSDILNDLLFAARGRLLLNDSGEWELTIDKIITDKSAYFGSGEGTWENIAEVSNYSKTPTNEALKKVILRYRYNEGESEYSYKYERDVFDFGEEREFESPFIRNHTTADKLICYLQKRAQYRDTRITLLVGIEGRFLEEGQVIDLQVPRFSIEAEFQIASIARRINDFNLDLVSHNNLMHVYTAGTLNVDPIPQATQPAAGPKDLKDPDAPYYEAPKTPVSIGGISWEYLVAGTGEVTARLLGQAFKHPDDINFSHMLVGIRMHDSAVSAYRWFDGYEYDHSTHEWRALLDFPASGFDGLGVFLEGTGGVTNYFDAQVVSVNIFGRRSAAASFLNEKIGYKDAVVGSTPIVPTKISSITVSNSFKNFTWYWTPCAVLDIKDYHIQIDDEPTFSSPRLIDTFVKSNSFAYTTAIAYGSNIYFRVRPRNTTCVEAWQGVNNWTDLTTVVSNTINIPDDSLTGLMIAPAVAGTGLTQDGSGNLQVNPDGTTIEVSGDTFRVKADGIGADQIADDAVTEAEIRFGSTATGASAGADTLPANPIGFINVDIGGTIRRIPYYGT